MTNIPHAASLNLDEWHMRNKPIALTKSRLIRASSNFTSGAAMERMRWVMKRREVTGGEGRRWEGRRGKGRGEEEKEGDERGGELLLTP